MGQLTHAERRFQILHLSRQQHKFGKSNCLRIHASTAMATEGHASNVQPAEANVGLVNSVVRGESDVYRVLWRLWLALVTLSHLRNRGSPLRILRRRVFSGRCLPHCRCGNSVLPSRMCQPKCLMGLSTAQDRAASECPKGLVFGNIDVHAGVMHSQSCRSQRFLGLWVPVRASGSHVGVSTPTSARRTLLAPSSRWVRWSPWSSARCRFFTPTRVMIPFGISFQVRGSLRQQVLPVS